MTIKNKTVDDIELHEKPKIETIKRSDSSKQVKEVEINPTIELICRPSQEPFEATLTIKYNPQDELIELVSFQKWLDEFNNETIESLVGKVKLKLEDVLEGPKVTVSGRAVSDIHPETTVKTNKK